MLHSSWLRVRLSTIQLNFSPPAHCFSASGKVTRTLPSTVSFAAEPASENAVFEMWSLPGVQYVFHLLSKIFLFSAVILYASLSSPLVPWFEVVWFLQQSSSTFQSYQGKHLSSAPWACAKSSAEELPTWEHSQPQRGCGEQQEYLNWLRRLEHFWYLWLCFFVLNPPDLNTKMPGALGFSEKHGPRMGMDSGISVKDKTGVLSHKV